MERVQQRQRARLLDRCRGAEAQRGRLRAAGACCLRGANEDECERASGHVMLSPCAVYPNGGIVPVDCSAVAWAQHESYPPPPRVSIFVAGGGSSVGRAPGLQAAI